MNTSDNAPGDKVVVDTVELEVTSRTSARFAGGDAGVVRAKGTRDQVSIVPSANGTGRTRRTGELARDPAEVLRAWPHSMAGGDARIPAPARASAAAPATGSPAKRRADDKITLAHLALDLYREVEQIQAGSRRVSAHHEDSELCANHGCQLRIDALRGALVEALLLVQRVAMLQPTDRADIEDRIQQLLELLER